MSTQRRHTSRGQQGFTLVELVVVIAILGVMAAIAVPMVNNFLSSSKEQAYIADQSTIQAAVVAYMSSPSNVRFLGRRQFPIFAAGKIDGGFVLKSDNPGSPLTIEGNPWGGARGGAPHWTDDLPPNGNGVRDPVEEVLQSEALPNAAGWHVATVDREGTEYLVDSRDFFIDFNKLVEVGLLEKIPASASSDNGGIAASGSYSWYVDSLGKVQSVFFFFPERDQTGYQQVYP